MLIILYSTPLYSQRTIKGKIIDELNNPLLGIGIYYDLNASGIITNMDGEFSIDIPDSVESIMIIIDRICLNTCFQFDIYEIINEQFSILDKDSIIVKLIRNPNSSFNEILKPEKNKNVLASDLRYILKYNWLGKLSQVFTLDKDTGEIKYIWDIEYDKGVINISNYAWNEDASNRKEKKYFLSTIHLAYDNKGAIRRKSVYVEYGLHYEQQFTRYHYENNRIDSVITFKSITMGQMENATTFEYQKDMLIHIIQNEILRRKMYKKIDPVYFNSDFKLIEIK